MSVDDKRSSLIANLGKSGSIDDLWREWLEINTAGTAKSVVDLEAIFLDEAGVEAGAMNDRWEKWFNYPPRALSGAVPDMREDYWGTATLALVGDFQISGYPYTVAEDAGSVTITVERVNGDSGVASVTLTTRGRQIGGDTQAELHAAGYALDDRYYTPGNYTGSSQVIEFADGDTSKTATVSITDWTGYTGTLIFSVGLENPSSGAGIVPGNEVEMLSDRLVSITDTDSAPASSGTLQLSAATYSGSESSGTITLTVTRVGGTDNAVSCDLSTVSGGTGVAATDYTAISSQTVNFSAGSSTSQTVSLQTMILLLFIIKT